MTETWIAGFRTAVVDPSGANNLAAPRGFADETVLQVLHLAGGGKRLRVRVSNRYGTAPLVVGAAAVARHAGEFQAEPGSVVALSVRGERRFTVAPGAEIVSDDVELAAASGEDLLLGLYLPESTEPATYSQAPAQDALVVAGEQVGGRRTGDGTLAPTRFYVSGVDVLAAQGTPVVVALGDSWFEGVGTTPGTNNRVVDRLTAGLARGWAVNQGISGNQLLLDDVGESGLHRFDRDVLAVPGVTHVVVNLGINDLGLGEVATAADLIAGYTELAERAHRAGIAVYANTIGPFAGVIYPEVNVEPAIPVRRQVNEWLCATDVFDGVFDIATAVADPANPDYIRPDLDCGDGLHLNDEGSRIMAAAIRIPDLVRVAAAA
ncbi:GDSL-type esterase/lipase family protein [Nocardia stercoris]|uniref:SGNH/GDSL hydrolase family protein n=1 Tax=Nocardia stercoris TaxID=2483361 RepID=A0A3M2KXN9_9NOCA|nr:GDSL-type esterase/lipase family protein [Nocardia stercoris]RMI28295.1 SGNH/GDSL hydrolase family protein [Nocardia stercoris]